MYHNILILSCLYYTAYVLTASFMWSKKEKMYDYLVGISVNDEPICPGVAITVFTVITSANPLQKYWENISSVKIHTVNNKYNRSTVRNIESIYGDQGYRKNQWVQMGFDDTHSSIHDLMLIKLEKPIKKSQNRGPRFANLPFVNSVFNAPLQTTGWIVIGFGYTDKQHILNNSYLEVTKLSGTLVDCDEWIPREWGHFICISDDDDLRTIPSGGPLTLLKQKRPIIYGISSFSLKKGNDTILVFTNLKKYRFGLSGYTPNITKSKKKP